MSRTGVAVAGLAIVLAACTSGGGSAPVKQVDTQYGDSSPAESPGAGPAACVAAGGLCEVGAVCQVPAFPNCGGGAVCCLDFCLPGAKVETLQAESYDQSCTTDSDCVAVGLGNACLACEILCPNAGINVAAQPQYKADVARSAAGAPGVTCGCPTASSSSVCCNGGACSMNCQSPVDAATDAGGDATTSASDATDTSDASATGAE